MTLDRILSRLDETAATDINGAVKFIKDCYARAGLQVKLQKNGATVIELIYSDKVVAIDHVFSLAGSELEVDTGVTPWFIKKLDNKTRRRLDDLEYENMGMGSNIAEAARAVSRVKTAISRYGRSGGTGSEDCPQIIKILEKDIKALDLIKSKMNK